jgi:DNA-binding CsgD family transcriptional regulator
LSAALSVIESPNDRQEVLSCAGLMDIIRGENGKTVERLYLQLRDDPRHRVHRGAPETLHIVGMALLDSGRFAAVRDLIHTIDPHWSNDEYAQSFIGLLLHRMHRYNGDPDQAAHELDVRVKSRTWAGGFIGRAIWLTAEIDADITGGRPSRASAKLASLFESLGPLDPVGDATVARAQLQLAHSWMTRTYVDAEPLTPPIWGYWRQARLELIQAATLGAAGLSEDAWRAATSAATRAEGEGRFRVALDAVHLAGRIRVTPELVTQAEAIAGKCDDHHADQIVVHLRALIERDTETLRAVGEAFEGCGSFAAACEIGHDLRRFARRNEHVLAADRLLQRMDQRQVLPLIVHRSDQPQVRVDMSHLTNRERLAVQLVASGASNAQVAEELGIAVRTAETHLQRGYTKLGVNNRAELRALFQSS